MMVMISSFSIFGVLCQTTKVVSKCCRLLCKQADAGDSRGVGRAAERARATRCVASCRTRAHFGGTPLVAGEKVFRRKPKQAIVPRDLRKRALGWRRPRGRTQGRCRVATTQAGRAGRRLLCTRTKTGSRDHHSRISGGPRQRVCSKEGNNDNSSSGLVGPEAVILRAPRPRAPSDRPLADPLPPCTDLRWRRGPGSSRQAGRLPVPVSVREAPPSPLP